MYKNQHLNPFLRFFMPTLSFSLYPFVLLSYVPRNNSFNEDILWSRIKVIYLLPISHLVWRSNRGGSALPWSRKCVIKERTITNSYLELLWLGGCLHRTVTTVPVYFRGIGIPYFAEVSNLHKRIPYTRSVVVVDDVTYGDSWKGDKVNESSHHIFFFYTLETVFYLYSN